ncbi:MAG: DegT/DnrJ/EryC1/StrS aminotransferase family protein, partial [Spirochaetales bacterium]|nr:DegT/DnrJ/EryC1/StrS aminotransferase family protein [Spirochaetales bacterium]
KPTLKRRDMDSVLQTMVNEKIGPGERARAFVQSFCEVVGATSGIAFRTYPDCLSYALSVVGVSEGTKVAVSPLSPEIYRSVLMHLGAEMVLVDIDRQTGCPDENLLQQSGAEVLLLYESFGTLPVRYNEQTTYPECCDYSFLKVIEDITDSIGSSVKEECFAGKIGQIVVCAMEEDSVVSAGGGAVLAVRGEFVDKIRGKRPSKYLTMPDMNAALGMVQLSNLKDSCARRREILSVYQQSLAKTRHRQFGLTLFDYDSNAFRFAVHLDSRPDETVKFASKHDVPVRMAFDDCLLKDCEGDPFELAPVSASFFYRTVEFPLYEFLKPNEIDGIAKVISHLP